MYILWRGKERPTGEMVASLMAAQWQKDFNIPTARVMFDGHEWAVMVESKDGAEPMGRSSEASYERDQMGR